MPHSLIAALAAAVLAFGAPLAPAQPKPPADKAPKVEESRPATTDKAVGVENAIAMCEGCHGIPGYKTAFPDVYHVPRIGGQQPGYIFNALKAYKSGERSHPSMRGIASGLTEEQMKALADYYGGAK